MQNGPKFGTVKSYCVVIVVQTKVVNLVNLAPLSLHYTTVGHRGPAGGENDLTGG